MPRYRLIIEYDGGGFHGWQRQRGQLSVQETLETAAARLEGAARTVTGAGRTDAGVHALGQVAHLDMEKDWDPFRLAQALNWHVRPAPVAVVGAAIAAPDFHARFDAVRRRYRYTIVARRAPLTVLRGHAWRVTPPLDIEAMREGAAAMIGRHDFTTFRSSECQAASPVKTLDAVEIGAEGEAVQFDLAARSFLHNQVRSMVGTLERVGAGAWAPSRVAEALAARERSACGPVAPPDGLFLVGVDYPADFGAG